MITACCVLKSGGVYTPEWVDRLQRAVVQHMNAEHRFVCLTDMDVSCETIPLRHGWPGWWSKMEVFALDGWVLFLDLDVAVVGSLDALINGLSEPFDGRSFQTDGTLVATRDFMRRGQYNTSVMLIEGRRDLYEAFVGRAEACMKKWRGDQEMLSEIAPEAHVWTGGQVVSYRKHCRARLHIPGHPPPSIRPPPIASVVCFHGLPKMPDAGGWPQEYWAA